MSRRPALLVARTLLRRRLRRALDRPRRTALTGGMFLFPLAVLFAPSGYGGAGYAPTTGGSLAGPEGTVMVSDLLPPLFTAGWLLFLAAAAFTVDDSLDDVDAGGLLVLGGGVRATVLGTMLAGHARRLAMFGIWFVAGGVAIVLGGAGVASLPLGAVGFALLLVSATTAGQAVGLFARRELFDRGHDVRRVGLSVVAAVYAAYFAVTLGVPAAGDVAISLAGRLPTAWFAEWLLVEYPGRAVRPARLVGSLVAGIAVVALGFRAKVHLAADVWFRRPGEASGTEHTGADPFRLVRTALRRVVGPAAAALAWQVTLRRLRRPKLFLVPVVLAATFWHDAAAALSAVHYPPAVALFAAVAVPPVVALNPLADEGTALPHLLAGGLSGRSFVAGYAAAAAAFAWVGAAVGFGVVAVTAGLSLRPTLAAVAVAAVLPFATAAVAVAVGCLFPRSEAADLAANEGLGLPNRYAFGSYLAVVGVAAAPLLTGLLVVSDPTVTLATAGLSLVLGFGAAVLAERIAARRFEGFVLD